MKILSEAVKNFLKKEDMRFEQFDDPRIVRVTCQGKNTTLTTYIHADDDDKILECWTPCPLNVPREKLVKAMTLVTLVNARLRIGNFDLEMKEGIVHFRTSVQLGTAKVEHEVIKHLIFGNLFTMDLFSPIIAAVVCGDIAPMDALKMVEKSKSKQFGKDGLDNPPRIGGRFADLTDNSNN